jgi:hypothetical protein
MLVRAACHALAGRSQGRRSPGAAGPGYAGPDGRPRLARGGGGRDVGPRKRDHDPGLCQGRGPDDREPGAVSGGSDGV